MPSHYALTGITSKADTGLVTQGWVGDKPCLVTVDTGAYMTVARPDIATGWPEKQPNPGLALQRVSGEALPIMKEVSLTLTLGLHLLKISAFATDELILGLDVLRAYDASLDLGRQTLRLAEEEVSLWNPGEGPRPSSLVMAKDKVIPARCEGIVIARLESPLGVENGLVELSPQAHPPDGIYIARTLVQDCQEVPIRVLNATHRDQKLTRGSPLAHCEPVTLVTLPDMGEPHARDSSTKLQDITETVRPHLSKEEFKDLEELLTEYKDIFAVDSEDHGTDLKESSFSVEICLRRLLLSNGPINMPQYSLFLKLMNFMIYI
jgi:hypothetical protein